MTRALLLLLALCAFAIACGGGDDGAPVSGPNVAARERFADKMAEQGFLRPPVPHYIPPAVSQIGGELDDATATHIVVSYPPIAAGATAPYLTVVANLDPGGVQPCTPGIGPQPYAIQCLEVNGEKSMFQVTPSDTTVQATLLTHVGDLSVFVSVDWPATSKEDIPAAEQAKTEALTVVQQLAVD